MSCNLNKNYTPLNTNCIWFAIYNGWYNFGFVRSTIYSHWTILYMQNNKISRHYRPCICFTSSVNLKPNNDNYMYTKWEVRSDYTGIENNNTTPHGRHNSFLLQLLPLIRYFYIKIYSISYYSKIQIFASIHCTLFFIVLKSHFW